MSNSIYRNVLSFLFGVMCSTLTLVAIFAGILNHFFLIKVLVLLFVLFIHRAFFTMPIYKNHAFSIAVFLTYVYSLSISMNTHFNYAARYFLTKSNLEYLAIEISKSAFSSCDNEVLENIDIHKNILVDPYTGGSLNILKLNDKCVIYSFGIDRDDDNANSFDEANLIYHPRSELWTIMTVPKWLYSESFIEEKLSGDIVVLVNSK